MLVRCGRCESGAVLAFFCLDRGFDRAATARGPQVPHPRALPHRPHHQGLPGRVRAPLLDQPGEALRGDVQAQVNTAKTNDQNE